MRDIEIKVLSESPAIRAMLSETLIETVANGGSVSFMHPLAPEAADAFWRDSLASAERGERIVFGAFDREKLVGTVTLLLGLPSNQPHQAFTSASGSNSPESSRTTHSVPTAA
jgi:hypothetical protein